MISLINKKTSWLILTFCAFSSLHVYGQSKAIDPFKDDYVNYVPDFAEKAKRWPYSEKEMERSSEIKYYTLNITLKETLKSRLVKPTLNTLIK